MAPVIEDIREQPTQAQLRLLRSHLPYSLNVLRRLQVAAGAFDSASPGKEAGAGTSPYAHILFAYDDDTSQSLESGERPFAAAYLDLSKAPETAAFVYASDQDTTEEDATKHNAPLYPADPPLTAEWPVDRGEELVAPWTLERRARCRRLVLALLRHIQSIAKEEAAVILPLLAAQQPSSSPDVAAKAAAAAANFLTQLKINIHDGVRHLLQHPAATSASASSLRPVTAVIWPYDKWLFRFEDVPVLSDLGDTELLVTLPPKEGETTGAPSTLVWDCVHTLADLALVTSRTYVPRVNKTLLSVPSVALREKESGVLQAWAFLGIDGSLWTLHTEPAYRGLGLAKTLASRLFRQYCGVFDAVVGGSDNHSNSNNNNQGDGWIMADVSSDNRQSQGVCRRLGAKRTWSSSWVVLDYDSLGDDE